MAQTKKPFYMEKTFWGCVALFVSGGLTSIGVTGAASIISTLAAVIGVPLTAYGAADRLKK